MGDRSSNHCGYRNWRRAQRWTVGEGIWGMARWSASPVDAVKRSD